MPIGQHKRHWEAREELHVTRSMKTVVLPSCLDIILRQGQVIVGKTGASVVSKSLN